MCRQFPEPISLCDFGGGFNTEKVHKYVIGKQAVQHIGVNDWKWKPGTEPE